MKWLSRKIFALVGGVLPNSPNTSILDIADQQITKTAFAVSVVFIITLGPASFHCILGFTGLVEFEYSNDFQIIEVFLATLDSCVTPFIYILFMPIFKKILKETFCVQSMIRQCQFR